MHCILQFFKTIDSKGQVWFSFCAEQPVSSMDNDIEFIKHIISVDDNEIEIVHDRPGCDTGMQLKLLDAILCNDRPGGRTGSPTMYFNTVLNPGGLGELPGSKLASVG